MSTEKIKESTQVRGIAAAVQAQAFPTFETLNALVEQFGYYLVKKEN